MPFKLTPSGWILSSVATKIPGESVVISDGHVRPRERTRRSRVWSSRSAFTQTTAAYDADSDHHAARHWNADFEPYIDAFIRLVPDNRHPIVDAGCGAGRDVAAFVARGFHCIGVDLSSGMLTQARNRVADPKARWLQADIRAIPLGTNSAGGVWINAALLHLDVDGQTDALRDSRRLLLPGRPLFVSTLEGPGLSSRRNAAGFTRWFWGTNLSSLLRIMKSVGFDIVSAKTEVGIVRGDWVNVLALAP